MDDRSEHGQSVGGDDSGSRPPMETLQEYLQADNIAELLSDEELSEIGQKAKRELDIDLASRSEWASDYAEAMKLALQTAEKKDYPWPNAANIKFPLLTVAAIQFAARAYPAIIAGEAVVKAKVVGKDEDGKKRSRGDRIGRHMSWQFMHEMPEWEEDTDKLLHVLPIAGMCFRKTYFDPLLGRNRSDLVMPDKIVINNGARSIETVPRITQIIDDLYPNDIEERFRSGIFRRIELTRPASAGDDEDAPQEWCEQHRTLDLDKDGYAEPYIVTFHRDSTQVVRIVPNFRADNIAVNEQGEIARIERDQYFTKYGFLPNPSGGFHDIGFGYLLRPMNEAVNSTINQLLDAGHLSNLAGGFIGKGARLRGGQTRFKPGQWVPVDVGGAKLRDNLVPLPVKEPSLVLFQLLGLLINAASDISSVKDIMTGEAQGRNQSPTTTLALIEQGMQMFTAIYKRIFRSLRGEYGKAYALNGRYLDPESYFAVLDTPEAVSPEDYAEGDFDIVPVADPNVATNMQRLARAEMLMMFKDDPLFNGRKIRERFLETANVEDVDQLLLDEAPQDPRMLQAADEIEIKKRELDLKERKFEFESMERMAKVLKLIAEAEAVEAGPQLEEYKQEMAFLSKWVQGEQKNVDQGTGFGMAQKPADQGVPGVSDGAQAGFDGALG